MSAFEIGSAITWLEAIYLVSALLKDPSSNLQAAKNKWKHPVSFEYIVSAHTFDLLATVNSKKKPKPYPVPWQTADKKKMGSAKSNQHALRALDSMNPKGD